jgi:hypothetical protein
MCFITSQCNQMTGTCVEEPLQSSYKKYIKIVWITKVLFEDVYEI